MRRLHKPTEHFGHAAMSLTVAVSSCASLEQMGASSISGGAAVFAESTVYFFVEEYLLDSQTATIGVSYTQAAAVAIATFTSLINRQFIEDTFSRAASSDVLMEGTATSISPHIRRGVLVNG